MVFHIIQSKFYCYLLTVVLVLDFLLFFVWWVVVCGVFLGFFLLLFFIFLVSLTDVIIYFIFSRHDETAVPVCSMSALTSS